MTTLKLGTRGSELARTQSQHVADAIHSATGAQVELVVISTKGDRVRDRPLQEVGGKGLFTKEIEEAMLGGEVDFAVHSMKDMPTEGPDGLEIAVIPERVDARDALIGARLADLPAGAVIGTGSVRRQLQIRAARPDLEVRGIRGNVGTRISKQRDGTYDAIVLAMAGLKRLGLTSAVTELLEVDTMIPAVGQGALAVQCREDDHETKALLETVHHEPTATCVAAERAFMEAVSGGCSAPAACYAHWEQGQVVAHGVWAASETGEAKRLTLRCDPLHVVAMGRDLARQLMG